MNRVRRSGMALAVTWLLFAPAPKAQTARLPPDLDSYVEQTRKTFQVPAIAVAIVKDGKVVLTKGYGVKKLGESAPVDENTLFGIGSNTKAFTTALLASLVEEQKINWDDKVYQHLPGFQMYDPYVSHEMTIRDLITHRSGLGLGQGDLLFWPTTTFTRDEIVYKLRFMKPATSFRSAYAYDNLLYIAAGQIVAHATGKSWEDNVRERILRPLRMDTTNLSVTDFKPGDNYAWPHTAIGGPLRTIDFVPLDNAAPAGAINSSVAEMSKWVLLQLSHGKFPDDTRLFGDRNSWEMWSAQTILPIAPGRPDNPLAALSPRFQAYALGWVLRDYQGRRLVGHTGGVAGFYSEVMLVPEENLGVVVLTNAETPAIDAVSFRILDSYFGLPATDWNVRFKTVDDRVKKQAEEAMAKAASARAADSRPSLALERYAGVYTDPWYGPASMKIEEGTLVFRLDHTPKAVGDVEHWQFDTFKVKWRDRTIEDAFVTFALKANGEIDHMTMQAVSPLADFSFDYQDLWFVKTK